MGISLPKYDTLTVYGYPISTAETYAAERGLKFEMLGVTWLEPVYSWSADWRSVTATRTAAEREDVVQTETVAASLRECLSPTQEQAGWAEYVTEAFEREEFEIQQLHLDIPALSQMRVLMLPDSLQTLEAEALAGTDSEAILVPSACASIGTDAFAGCAALRYVRVPAALEEAAYEALSGCEGVVVDAAE